MSVRYGPLAPLLAVVAGLAAGACEPAGESPGTSGGASADTAAVPTDAAAPAEGPESGTRADPRALGDYPLRLVNPRQVPALVYASAGAGEVLLDTVAAGDSLLLEVRLRTDTVVLRAEGPDGGERGSGVVPLGDETARWEVP